MSPASGGATRSNWRGGGVRQGSSTPSPGFAPPITIHIEEGEQPVSTEQESVQRLAEIRERVSQVTEWFPEGVQTKDMQHLLSIIDSLTAERDEAYQRGVRDERMSHVEYVCNVSMQTGTLARSCLELRARADAAEAERDGFRAARDALVAAEAARIDELEAEVKRLREALDGAYRERAQMAVALARLFPSWVSIDPDEPDWPVLYVQLPTGQVSWHFSPTDRDLLDGITVGGPAWDGHTTEEKYARLAALATPPSEGGQS